MLAGMPVRLCLLAPLLAAALLAGAACSDKPQAPATTATSATGAAATPADSPSPGPVKALPAPGLQPAATPESGGKRLGTPSGTSTTARDPAFTAFPGAKAYWGKLGNAVYRIELPANWNGELVLWAHGFAGFGTQVEVADPPAVMRKAWIDSGYAWAASSYSENGYVPGIGADDTLALKKQFERLFDAPRRTYLAGASMGGNVVTLALENQGDPYDGALAVCGALGGEEQVDYLVSWPMVAEYVTGVKLPLDQNAQQALPAVLSAVGKLGEALQPTPQGRQFQSIVRNLTGGPRPFFLEGYREQYQVNIGFFIADPQRKLTAVGAATNQDTHYDIDPGLGLTDEQVNDGVRRIKPDSAARDGAKHPDAVPTTGKFHTPLLTLHNTGDLFVPITHEQSYRAKAEAAGNGDRLVQRAIRAAGHCRFSDQEQLAAWNDLVAWVADGKKPAGEDLRGDLSDAGKQFTNPLRPGDPGTK